MLEGSFNELYRFLELLFNQTRYYTNVNGSTIVWFIIAFCIIVLGVVNVWFPNRPIFKALFILFGLYSIVTTNILLVFAFLIGILSSIHFKANDVRENSLELRKNAR